MSVDWDWLQNYNSRLPMPAPSVPQGYNGPWGGQGQSNYTVSMPAPSVPGVAPSPGAGGGNNAGSGGAVAAQPSAQSQAGARRRAFLLGYGGGFGRFAGDVHERVRSMPAPGGLGLLVLILVVLLFVLVPVNGHKTRMGLIWDVTTGRAKLPVNAPGGPPNTPTSGSANSAHPTGLAAAAGGEALQAGQGLSQFFNWTNQADAWLLQQAPWLGGLYDPSGVPHP